MTTQRMPFRTRVGLMLAGWGTVGVCYSAGRLTPRAAHVLQEGMLDRVIPFDASAVWLYLSFFLLVPVAYFLAAPARVRPLASAMQMSAVFAAVVFFAWPTTLVYPAVPSGTLAGVLLNALAEADSAQNCMPSLHGALTLLCIVALWQRERPWRNAAVLMWGVAIMFSVVATRRHLTIDLGAGLLLGAACAWFAARRLSVAQAGLDAGGQPSREFVQSGD